MKTSMSIVWLATVRNVRTKLLSLSENIFISELSF